jgi:hypothetical protein
MGARLALVAAVTATVLATAAVATGTSPRSGSKIPVPPKGLTGTLTLDYLEMESLHGHVVSSVFWTRESGPTGPSAAPEYTYGVTGETSWSIENGTIYADTPYPCSATWLSGTVKIDLRHIDGVLRLSTDGVRVKYEFQLDATGSQGVSGQVDIKCSDPAVGPYVADVGPPGAVSGRGLVSYGLPLAGEDEVQPGWKWSFDGSWPLPKPAPLKPRSSTIKVRKLQDPPPVPLDPPPVPLTRPANGSATLQGARGGGKQAPPVLGGTTFSVPKGAAAITIRIRLNGRGRALLAAQHRLRATLVLDVWYPGGPHATSRTPVLLTLG